MTCLPAGVASFSGWMAIKPRSWLGQPFSRRASTPAHWPGVSCAPAAGDYRGCLRRTGADMRRLVCALFWTGILVGAAIAQVYPARPITIIVPYAAGGPTDVVARVMAERMRTSLGQP